MNIGLLGFGAINQKVYQHFSTINTDIKFKKILVRDTKKYVNINNNLITDIPSNFLKESFDYVLEGAGHEALFSYGPEILKNQSNLLITSTGALTDDVFFQNLILVSKKYNKKVIIPSAGIGALDILTASSYGKLNKVNITVRKNTEAWFGTIAETKFDLRKYDENLILFSGTVREGAKLYPQNVNISATVALSGLGLDQTKLKIISDSSIKTHIISVKAKGDFGEFTFEENVIPYEENQKTGKIVSLAIIKSIDNLNSNFVIGT
jgi:aspartate dehydrogenase|tara:strand:+ start:234 stop:1028 length:795 start_codon:yes stop_codon:yes gene_type:complete